MVISRCPCVILPCRGAHAQNGSVSDIRDWSIQPDPCGACRKEKDNSAFQRDLVTCLSMTALENHKSNTS